MHWHPRLARLLLAVGLPAGILAGSVLASLSSPSPSAASSIHQIATYDSGGCTPTTCTNALPPSSNVHSTGSTANSVSVSWDAPPGVQVNQYTVSVTNASTGQPVTLENPNTPGIDPEMTINNLTPNTTYNVSVTYTTTSGANGPASSSGTASTSSG
jgi:hypothetical protein